MRKKTLGIIGGVVLVDWLVNIGAYIYYSFTTFGCIFMLVNASLCKVSSEKKIPIKP